MAKPHVYIAGPYSTGDVGQNIHNAIKAADWVVEAGGIPFIPHTMTHLWHIASPKEYEFWLEYDFAWLRKCQALYRLPGVSPGADREVWEAEWLRIPHFSHATSLRIWIADWQEKGAT